MDVSEKISRRNFVKAVAGSAAFFSLDMIPASAFAEENIKLTILHTNDWHSRIEAFPMDGSQHQGKGGAAIRAAIIKKIRSEEKNVLLLDAGDIFQGTPYFNFYGGELEFKLMSEMKYDAATIGNHDFDAGLDGLARQLPHAEFPFVCANYDFSETELKEKIKSHIIVKKNKLKIGIFGLGVELKGLVPDHLFGKTVYLDPLEKGNEIADKLKNEKKCDLVICLSHLGFSYKDQKVSDEILAQKSRNIDLIIGGHTHTFLDSPRVFKNMDGREIFVNQVGWAGINLGRLDYYFSARGKSLKIVDNTVEVSKKSISI